MNGVAARELERLRAERDAARHSALLQAERSARLVHQRDEMHKAMQEVRGSLFWRATFPARLAVDLLRPGSPRRRQIGMLRARMREIAAEEGWAAIWRRGLAYWRNRRRLRASGPAARDTMLGGPPTRPANHFLAPNVLIVAELSIAACAKYRVWHKQRMLQAIGIPTQVVNWTDRMGCQAAASKASFVILYRVPAEPQIIELIGTLRALRVPVWYDLDDLIFDRDLYLRDRNVNALPAAAREGVLAGAALYRQAMLACDGAIASTPALAGAMQAAGVAQTLVVENALDEETLRIAGTITQHGSDDGLVRIVYGAGSRTHDGDFRQCAAGLLAVLRARPQARLRIIGELGLPDEFATVAGQIEHLPPSNFETYLQRLAQCDISIAPLEPSLFNDAKSNIKFLEAGSVGLPSVCSPAGHFVHAVRPAHGRIAATAAEWETSLLELIDAPHTRQSLGAAARDYVLGHYSSTALQRGAIADLGRMIEGPRRTVLQVLCVTARFAPRRARGADAAAEATIFALAARDDVNVTVVTMVDRFTNNFAMTRYEQDGLAVFAIPVLGDDPVLAFDNPVAEAAFADVLDAVAPDCVLAFSIDGLGAALLRRAAERGIPYALQTESPWYLCARTDMIREEGRFCGQRRIDPLACTACQPLARHLEMRRTLLTPALQDAAALMVSNQGMADLYQANGVDAARIAIIPRGLPAPASPAASPIDAAHSGPLRIGFAGFPTRANGGEALALAFSQAASRLPPASLSLCLALERDVPGESLADIAYAFGVPLAGHDAADFAGFAAAIDVLAHLPAAPGGAPGAALAALADGAWPLLSAASPLAPAGAGEAARLADGHDAANLADAITALAGNAAALRHGRAARRSPWPSLAAEAASVRAVLARIMAPADRPEITRPS